MKRTLLLLALSAPLAAQGKRSAPLDGFDAYVAKAVRDWRVPGLAIAVVKDDSVVFIKGYGVRELGKPDPVTEHTKFGIMSTTKAFTAMLAAMVADSGRFALDDPATRWLPGFQLFDPYATRELTVRDLLTHRVGFGDPGFLWDNTGWDWDEVARRVRMVQPTTSLRASFEYNNVTYAAAGHAAARAAGTAWPELLRRRILEPLGMRETYATGAELRGLPDVAAPHGLVGDSVRVLSPNESVVDPVAPAGSVFSSASDMARWLRFLLDSGRVGGRRLVSEGNFRQLFTPQQVVPDPGDFYPALRLTKPHVLNYGLGWFLEDYRGQWVAMHTGSIEGRAAIVGLIPDRRLGVVVLENLDHAEVRHALMYTVFDRFIGDAAPGGGHDWSAEMRALYGALADTGAARARARETRRVAGTRPTLPLDRYAGTYADSLYGTAVVGSEGGRPTFRLGTQLGDLEHWQYDVFKVRWRDPFLGADYISFSLDPDGTVGELRLVGSPQRYGRVRTASSASPSR